MVKAILRLARAFTGIWSQLRTITRLLEWLMVNGLSGQLSGSLGTFNFVVHPPGLPPTTKQIKDAVGEKIESTPYSEEDEERLAGEVALDLLKRRSKGEKIDEEEPGGDWDIFA